MGGGGGGDNKYLTTESNVIKNSVLLYQIYYTVGIIQY